MQAQRLNITLPYELARDFKRAVPATKRSKFFADAIRKNLPKRNLKKEWIKSLKENKALYEEIHKDWASLDTEGWPD